VLVQQWTAKQYQARVTDLLLRALVAPPAS